MATTLHRGARYLVIAVSVLLALFVTAQVAQLVNLAGTVHPALGTAVAVVLLAVVAWLVAVPLLAYLRLERALVPPADTSGPAHDAFVARYLALCRRNPRLAGRPLTTEADLEAALAHLEGEAEKIANRTASQVFVGTAVSQYGSLDALIVAFVQARMVWEIGHVFHQRPSLRHLSYLYANVLAASVIASRLDQVDLSEYVRPVLTGLVGQSIAGVPGVAAVSGQLSNAVFHGSVNAFMTLRVGMVAIAYSRATIRPERGSVWRGAVARAGGLVVRTIATGSVEVSKAFAVAAAKSVTSAATGVGRSVAAGATAVGQSVVDAGRAVGTGASAAGAAMGRSTRAAVDGVAELGTNATKAVRDAAGKVAGRRKRGASPETEGGDEDPAS